MGSGTIKNGSETSASQPGYLLPFYVVFRNQFCKFVFVIVCLSLISEAKMRQEGRQVLESSWKVLGKFSTENRIFLKE
ncbi:hypothetical protein N0B16_09190 [Chryseobacterium sp. GMJ5]|uniref:Uncharacterized protein n=1 Tax=Chryseobacterium gilvum TaxID=2976534 RepID=A0ABT2VX83_9FLAO|nr:hypothetical protein [Chryseobacterium gilvum]MCU7614608.1 hypothetical protein [Chryseobacterium gilvum]